MKLNVRGLTSLMCAALLFLGSACAEDLSTNSEDTSSQQDASSPGDVSTPDDAVAPGGPNVAATDNADGTWTVPSLFTLLPLWYTGNVPRALECSSIQVNKELQCATHRDSSNLSPSSIKAIGLHEGGGLRYWKDDDRNEALHKLHRRPPMLLPRDKFSIFDPSKGHELEPYFGRRYGITGYSIGLKGETPETLHERLVKLCPEKRPLDQINGLPTVPCAASRLDAMSRVYGTSKA